MEKTITETALADFGVLMVLNCCVLQDKTIAKAMSILASSARIHNALITANVELSANIEEVGENLLQNCAFHDLPCELLVEALQIYTQQKDSICLN